MKRAGLIMWGAAVAAVGCASLVFFLASWRQGSERIELQPRSPGAGERAASEATENWPDCLAAHGRDAGPVECAQWAEDGISFRLLAIGANGSRVPLFEASDDSQGASRRTLIHVTGGPDEMPIAHARDPRLPVFRPSLRSGFTLASLAYWGTRFRTTLEPGEMKRAVRDLRRAVDYYSTQCQCRPVIIAESLGAHVVFEAFPGKEIGDIDLLAISPGLSGLGHAVEFYKTSDDYAKIRSNRITSHTYEPDENDAGSYLGTLMISTVDHLETFSSGFQGSLPSPADMSPCSRILAGTQDPINQDFFGFESRGHSKLVALDSGHDVYAERPSELSRELESFLQCVRSENGTHRD